MPCPFAATRSAPSISALASSEIFGRKFPAIPLPLPVTGQILSIPTQAASLAKVSGSGSDAYAERWELYWSGMELANCFSELCDADEQRRRFEKAREARRLLGEADYPVDDDFLACLPRIGSAAGVALGVDRLVMVLAASSSIDDVRVV